MLQRYIRALADLSINVKTFQPSISGTVARDELTPPLLVIAVRNANIGGTPHQSAPGWDAVQVRPIPRVGQPHTSAGRPYLLLIR